MPKIIFVFQKKKLINQNFDSNFENLEYVYAGINILSKKTP